MLLKYFIFQYCQFKLIFLNQIFLINYSHQILINHNNNNVTEIKNIIYIKYYYIIDQKSTNSLECSHAKKIKRIMKRGLQNKYFNIIVNNVKNV